MKTEKTEKTETKPEERKMTITKEQAKYWYAVAKKDLAEGNTEGAWNILKY